MQQVFIDLHVEVDQAHGTAKLDEVVTRFRTASRRSSQDHAPAVRTLLSDEFPRITLIGGPGEGKSTVGQYLAQVHRATLLHEEQVLDLRPGYAPARARVPFRVLMRDLAQYLTEDPNARSLDTYLCQQVFNMCSRSLQVEDLHRVLRQNPCLLVLDGLDEVADPVLRRLTMERIEEFLQRCESVFRADLHVLASTRPRGYSRQFDPEVFLHLNLRKLDAAQIDDYSRKWVNAKALEDEKSRRTLQVMEECVADEQVRLLLTTPLQATILLLIIATGGTPPPASARPCSTSTWRSSTGGRRPRESA